MVKPEVGAGPRPADPLGLVLSGGGMRGMYQAGVYYELSADPRFRDLAVVCGTSAGAVNAALISTGKSAEDLRDFWLDFSQEPPIVANVTYFTSVVSEVRTLLGDRPLRTLRAVLSRRSWHLLRFGGLLSAVFETVL